MVSLGVGLQGIFTHDGLSDYTVYINIINILFGHSENTSMHTTYYFIYIDMYIYHMYSYSIVWYSIV